jgi:cytochrome c2
MKLIIAPVVAAVVLAGASAAFSQPVAGERAYQKCYSCHATEPGKNDLTGPSLNRILDRPVASVDGFDYSPALKRFAARNPRWTSILLDRYVTDPEALVPGTSMTFHGIADPEERRELIRYLRTLDD